MAISEKLSVVTLQIANYRLQICRLKIVNVYRDSILVNQQKQVTKKKLLSTENSRIMELNKIPGRMVVRPRDIMNITGCSRSTATRILQKIRLVYGKAPDEWVIVSELCAVCGLKEEDVIKYLK